jgi:hypothetical protein
MARATDERLRQWLAAIEQAANNGGTSYGEAAWRLAEQIGQGFTLADGER